MAVNYLRGLLQAKKANMERMEEAVPGAVYDPMQELLSEAAWDEWAVMDEVARRADQVIGDPMDACLVVDESSFAKQGKQSAGVARQWDGRRGKVDNCQVGVFVSLANGQHVTPLYARLFLPKEWTGNRARMRKVRVPKEYQKAKSKPRIARDLLERCRAQKVRYGWISADGLYGNCPELLWSIAETGDTFMFHVHRDQRVFIEEPEPDKPAKRGRRGREPRWRTREPGQRIDALFADLPAGAWQRVQVRDATRGQLELLASSQLVWLFDTRTGRRERWHAVATRDPDSGEERFALSNAPDTTPLPRLVFMLGQRYWVERAFQNGKSSVGMAEYQARGWHSWHRHMTFVAMALLFMLEMRLTKKDTLPLLSCEDIKEVLAHILPDRRATEAEILRQLQIRHRKRQLAMERAHKRQRAGMVDGRDV